MDIQSSAKLNNGVNMPRLGLGVFKSPPGKETETAVREAIAAGYRSIDTASFYRNEESVGVAIRDAGVRRESLFITTKVWNSDQGYDKTRRAFDESMRLLATDYLDLYLVHWPVAGAYVETWRALVELYRDKRIRAIGVSNFQIHHIQELAERSDVVPAVNQVELHPYLQQRKLREYCREHEIVVEAWSPIAKGNVADDPVLQTIGAAHGKTPVQVALRWGLQSDIVVIPKSIQPDRIRSNAQVFDFSLNDAEMRRIDRLDREDDGRLGPHPDHFDF
ncbi:MAG: aldo/keto reductase [Spirochaetales bacterium]|nr:aldo/keto reductase [Spirochaetales bacterium]